MRRVCRLGMMSPHSTCLASKSPPTMVALLFWNSWALLLCVMSLLGWMYTESVSMSCLGAF